MSNRISIIFIIALIFPSFGLAAQLSANAIKQQRTLYKTLKQQLDNKEASAANSTLQQLDNNYLLKPFIEAEVLAANFKTNNSSDIEAFLNQYKNHDAAKKLKQQWLLYLAQTKNWPLFNKHYQGSTATSLKCANLQAKHQQQKSLQALLPTAQKLWATSFAHSTLCKEAFALFNNKSLITPDIAWQRFEKAYQVGNKKLGKTLIPYLSQNDKAIANKLIADTKNLEYWVATLKQPEPPKLASKTLKRLLRSLSHVDNSSIAGLMTRTNVKGLNNKDKLAVKRLNAWYIGKYSGIDAHYWINLQAEKNDPKFIEMQLRYSMQDKAWGLYHTTFKKAPSILKTQSEWRYWYAKALAANKQTNESQKLLKQLAKERHFYGFLASAELGLPPTIQQKPYQHQVAPDNTKVKQALAVAIEFFHVNEREKANRYWQKNSRKFNKQQWLQAADIAYQLNWYNKTLSSFANAGEREAIYYRFPLAYESTFNKYTQANNVEASWLTSMARQESRFAPSVKSRAGALGLLQIMPATARKLSQKHGLKYSKEKLKSPTFNIELSSLYVRQMLDRFDNNYLLATAAYNAGPHRVDEWLGIRPMTKDWVHWVATIPYKETRHYVKNVATYNLIYRHILNENDASSLLLATNL